MWLLRHLSALSGAAVRLYYRATRDGGTVPDSGPVLVVGNHPNSLLDPAFLAWVARRPVRFLAKAPLFTDRLVGWLVRASGSIPVYRRQDDPGQMGRNDETFRAVHDVLAGGAAVALFPEGISHSEPSLAPLKTGAARIALGAARRVGHAFPIVPVGLVFRAKDQFRSEAHAVVGDPVEWDDLAMRGDHDHEAVRVLTERIAHAMRSVTLNLARWEDEAVVRTAEAVWAGAHGLEESAAGRTARLGTTADVLARIRASGDEHWNALAVDVSDFARTLAMLRMQPEDVTVDTGLSSAARWTMRRLTLLGLVQFALAAVAIVVFWIPYRLTGFVAGRMTHDKDTVSTYRVLGGALIFVVWIAALATVAGVIGGWGFAIAAALALPIVAVAGLYAAEHWRWTLVTARRWLLVRRGGAAIIALRNRQAELARRLDAALVAHFPDS